MGFQPDIAVYSADRQLKLVVEVKSMVNADPRWAAKFRKNLLEHEAVPASPFFLLVLVDHLYLWGQGWHDASGLPDFQVPTSVALKRYLPEPSELGGGISGLGLELAVRLWLSALTGCGADWEDANANAAWLSSSGLLAAIRHGTVRSEAFA